MSEIAIYKGPYLGDEKHYVRLDAYNEIKAQRDAMAAENVALKNFAWSEVVAADQEKEDRWMMECTGARDRFISMQTPTTDSYLNSVRAEGVESFAHHQRVIADSLSGGEQRRHRITACRAEDFAAQLRSGEPS